jgi:hypothetical protein
MREDNEAAQPSHSVCPPCRLRYLQQLTDIPQATSNQEQFSATRKLEQDSAEQ